VDGYIFLHRGGNDCGIASDAVYGRVDDAYVVEGATEAAQKLAVAGGLRLATADEGL